MSAGQYRTSISEYAEAFDSVRLAKNIFWLLILAAVVVQLAGFVLVHFVGVLDNARTDAGTLQQVLHWLMPAVKFIALVAGLLLMLALMFAVKLSLLERMGGVAGLMSAFFWSLILFAILVPWQDVMTGTFASGALYSLGDLQRSRGRVDPGLFDRIIFYARYLAYPIVALLVALIVQLKFARGYRQIVSSLAAGAQAQAASQQAPTGGGTGPGDD